MACFSLSELHNGALPDAESSADRALTLLVRSVNARPDDATGWTGLGAVAAKVRIHEDRLLAHRQLFNYCHVSRSQHSSD